MNKLDEILAIEAIRKLKATYFRALDTKDWLSLGAAMAEDVVCDYRGAATDPSSGVNAVPDATEKELIGREEVVAVLKHSLEKAVTVHQGFMPEIEVTSPERARGTWSMHDSLRFPIGSAIAGLEGFGHYSETYVCVGGRWMIETLRLSRLRVDILRF